MFSPFVINSFIFVINDENILVISILQELHFLSLGNFTYDTFSTFTFSDNLSSLFLFFDLLRTSFNEADACELLYLLVFLFH